MAGTTETQEEIIACYVGPKYRPSAGDLAFIVQTGRLVLSFGHSGMDKFERGLDAITLL